MKQTEIPIQASPMHENSRRWLSWYMAQQELQEEPLEEEPETTLTHEKIWHMKQRMRALIHPFSAHCIPGEILLLSSLVAQAHRPVYVLILSVSNDSVEITPYSPAPYPACSREFRTESKDSQLSVLQMWNTHTVARELVERAWHIDTVPAERMVDIAQFREFGMERYPQSCGTPITGHADCRIAYRQQERAIYTPLSAITHLYAFAKSEQDSLVQFPRKIPAAAANEESGYTPLITYSYSENPSASPLTGNDTLKCLYFHSYDTNDTDVPEYRWSCASQEHYGSFLLLLDARSGTLVGRAELQDDIEHSSLYKVTVFHPEALQGPLLSPADLLLLGYVYEPI